MVVIRRNSCLICFVSLSPPPPDSCLPWFFCLLSTTTTLPALYFLPTYPTLFFAVVTFSSFPTHHGCHLPTFCLCAFCLPHLYPPSPTPSCIFMVLLLYALRFFPLPLLPLPTCLFFLHSLCMHAVVAFGADNMPGWWSGWFALGGAFPKRLLPLHNHLYHLFLCLTGWNTACACVSSRAFYLYHPTYHHQNMPWVATYRCLPCAAATATISLPNHHHYKGALCVFPCPRWRSLNLWRPGWVSMQSTSIHQSMAFLFPTLEGGSESAPCLPPTHYHHGG